MKGLPGQHSGAFECVFDSMHALDVCVLPRVRLGHIKAFAQQFIRMPLKRLSRHFPKHLHLHRRLFVIYIALTTKTQTWNPLFPCIHTPV